MRNREGPASESPDLSAVRRWVNQNPNLHAELTESVEHGGGRVTLIVNVPEHSGMVRARIEVPALVQFPELLRFRRWQPSEQEAEWTLQWVLGLMRRQRELKLPTSVTSTGPDPRSGLIMISLNQVDPTYAAELEARGDGLVYVTPYPENSEMLGMPVTSAQTAPGAAVGRPISAAAVSRRLS
jgi:hypothetical protein